MGIRQVCLCLYNGSHQDNKQGQQMTNLQHAAAVEALALMFSTIKPEAIDTSTAVAFLKAHLNINSTQAYNIVRDSFVRVECGKVLDSFIKEGSI